MFAVYENLEHGNRFISAYEKGSEKLEDGTIAYKILHKAKTLKECQVFLFGEKGNVFTFTQEEIDICATALKNHANSQTSFEEKIKILALYYRFEMNLVHKIPQKVLTENE